MTFKSMFIIGTMFLMSLPSYAKSKQATKAAEVKKPTVEACKVLTADNMLTINDYYEGELISNIVQKAKALDSKLPSNEALCLVISSGGGYIDAGIELIENLNNLHRPVHTLTLFAASMGFQTVQGVNGKRYLVADGTLMSHKARGGFSGEFPGQLDQRYAYYLKRIARLDERAASRTNGKYNLQSYRNLIENEYWCDGKDCVDNGFADEVVTPKCDNSLNGTHNQLWSRFIYMGHLIEIVDTYSDCPLQTSPLSYQILIDGQPLFSNVADAKLTPTPVTTSSFYGPTPAQIVNPLTNLSVETAENIKRLVAEKLENRKNNYKVVKMY